jgi:penicillin amidase
MRPWIKIVIGLFVSFVLIFVVAGLIFYKMLSASLPEYKGEISSEEIKDNIEIYRDSLAIPYIFTNNDEDAAFALGYLHAQERLFVMDMARRAGEGRLSEILGEEAVPFDKMFLTIGLKRDARENVKRLNPVSLKLLQAYSNGVNLYIKNAKGHYAVEFDALGYDPEEWKPEHSLIVIRMMAWQLNISWWVDFAFSDLVLKLGEEKVKQILPKYEENGPYIIPSELKNYSSLDKGLMETDMAFRDFMGLSGTHLGSNNWIVNALKSASGKPIIANDPHLEYSAPGRWYAAVIKSGSETCSGVSLPGVPGIVIGKNNNISWALTNVMADDADFYVEKLDSTKKKYLYNGTWRDLITYKEKIKVKKGDDVNFEVKLTHRGPIITDIHPYTVFFQDKGIKSPPISMRWTGKDFSDELFAFYKINKAKNWNEFKSAVQMFNVPGQNFVYGDRNGNIGYAFGAKLPLRNYNSPTFIYDGTTDKYDWKGYVPASELPSLYNPPQNYIASANNKTVKDFKYHISNLWEPSSRIERITRLLNSKNKLSVEDYEKMQMDQVSPYAEKITSYILNAFKNKKVTDHNLTQVLELLGDWNFELNEESQVPAVYAMFFKYLLKNIYYDKMGNDLFNEFVFMANVPYRSVMQVLSDSTNTWWDNPKTPQIETRDEIIRKSLVEALTELEKKLGTDVTMWQWGNLHKVTFKHAFSGVSSILDKYINIGPFRIGGDGTTIFNTEYPFTEGFKKYPRLDQKEFENNVGPSMRYIFDFAQPDEFYLVLTTGQSGNLMSPHFRDMAKMWLYGGYIKIRTDEASIRKNKALLNINKK